jgi:glyoxylase-like metal-dependent hydrolase (beta-lactamase superfamily II)
MAGLRVHHLNCAHARGLTIGGDSQVCHVVLVETPASGLVLIDTGLGSMDYANMSARLGSFFSRFAKADIDPSLAAIEQIKTLGFQPRDVRHIVQTHLDLDHVGGLADFPWATVHVHANELAAATSRSGFIAQQRYRPVMWAHQPTWQTYSTNGEPWFGFEAVRQLTGLPHEIILIPLFGHTRGHSGVAVHSENGWLLHAGDAYFDAREVRQQQRACEFAVGIFQTILTTNRRQRFANQDRLRALIATHPEIRVFAAHNPIEFATLTAPSH